MKTNFFLIVRPAIGNSKYEVTGAISGDSDGWRTESRYFTGREQLETALQTARVLAPVGPSQMLAAVASGISVAFVLEAPVAAVALQVLYRVDPEQKLEKYFVIFNDLNGSYQHATLHCERHRPIVKGDTLEVDTPLGKRKVEVLEITQDEVEPFGTNDTRRNVSVNVKF